MSAVPSTPTALPDTGKTPEAALRRQAELLARKKNTHIAETLDSPLSEGSSLLHELQVHQIELEMQSDELCKIQHELEESRSRYFNLYDQAPFGYLVLCDKGLIRDANLAAAALFGVAENHLLKTPLSKYIFSEDQDKFYLEYKQFKKRGQKRNWETRLKRSDGSHFWAHIGATPAKTGECWITLGDITMSRKAEEGLRHAREVAVAANLAKSRFLAVVAHEFHTPLHLLTISTDILDQYGDRISAAERFEQHEQIRHATRQMSALIDSVSTFSRQEKEFSSINPVLLDIGALCSAIARDVKKVWGDGHELHVVIAPDCGTCLMSEVLLRRLLENLLTNAFRFTPAGGLVSLSVSRHPGRLLITVADNGIGIPECDQERIFEAFYRSSNVDARRGLGLGLSIVRDALHELKGSIAVNSTVGSGSTFFVELPIDNNFASEEHQR